MSVRGGGKESEKHAWLFTIFVSLQAYFTCCQKCIIKFRSLLMVKISCVLRRTDLSYEIISYSHFALSGFGILIQYLTEFHQFSVLEMPMP